jgi:uncharacterized repeat protein (TIGR01451 family)
MLPLTAGSNYYEGFYNSMWGEIGTQNPLPNTCDCSIDEDNSLALSWNLSLAPGASQKYSSIVTFSPLGVEPLTITKTADSSTVAGGASDGYTISVENPNTAPVTLATLTDTLGSGFTYQTGTTTGATTSDPGISGQTLTWDNVAIPASATGTVHFDVTAPSTPGTYYDDAEGTASGYTVVGTGATAPVTVTGTSKPATTLKVTAGSGDFNDATTVSALLTNTATSAPIAGETVNLTLNGKETCGGTTDATGTVSCSITPGEAAGGYTLAGSFAGDNTYQGSTGTAAFTVNLEETALSYTGPTSAVNGQPITLSGRLTTDDPMTGTPVPNESVMLTLGSGSPQSCSGTTDSTGTASCTISAVNQPTGSTAVSANFAGDAYYLPASDSSTVTVFNRMATGAFVIGDVSATSGKPVNFWGAQWAQNNGFSSGGAPKAMKGFANSPAALTCGSTWTTTTGNSSAPPANLPGTIDVIVSKKVTQSGSVISGTIAHIVEVKVNSGYGPSPGHAGWGEVISTIC